ncbi:undecaprenyl-diphosphate phosphatase [Wenzhouxiangella marina]|uniref:Undecaprenyl-diphosphatase n=1 Tax=Wenzhouxiangella marina TaxID=1579979 RepID=A0A0K0XUF7_9GAMM|nr:undecaprenyl-diphosphate phosphatase [Wenzhouxiangella marina]AKS41349.1 Undecaprenyl-diphosphatase [Wenzhouxiangella marina]MBB6086901.1 undecaprenyl-diphosphatase [Wenzhouxiangella marina]
MDWIQALWLALVQGLTEFLPVSSQAHLVLASLLSGEVYQGLDFDIMLHAGSLVAVVLYFRSELIQMARDWLRSLVGGPKTPDSKLAWWIILATIPAGIAGLLFKDHAEAALRSPVIMAWALIAFGLALGWADWRFRGQRDEHSLRLRDVLIIGLAQALALIPGTSRSGITITAALFLGLNRESASRFSFLLSIPIIAAAGLLAALDLSESGFESGFGVLFIGFLAAAISTYACIHYFLAFIKRIGMLPFVLYRVFLGLLLLGFAL